MLEIEFHYMVYVNVSERCGGNPNVLFEIFMYIFIVLVFL